MPDNLQQLTPEEILLLSLCRLHFTDKQKIEIGEYMQKVTDWNYFVRSANEHGIIALTWYNISKTGNAQFIPLEFIQKLHAGYLKSLTRNTFIFNLLEEVSSLAEKEEIKIVLLKGLTLEKIVYGNIGLRQMNDLDILVRQEDALKLRKILLVNGFEAEPMISPFHKMLPTYLNHLPVMAKKGLSIEIHYRLFDQIGNSLIPEFLDKSISAGISNNNVFIPQPKLHFLYLIKHLEKHESCGSSQLRLYTDLTVMLSIYRDEIFTPKLFEYAGMAEISESLAEKLYILKTIWGAEYPQWVNSKLDKYGSEVAINKFYHFLRFPADPEYEEDRGSLLKMTKDISGNFEKFLFFLGHLLPSLTYMKFRYGTRTRVGAIFYYPVRWGRLLRLLVGGRV